MGPTQGYPQEKNGMKKYRCSGIQTQRKIEERKINEENRWDHSTQTFNDTPSKNPHSLTQEKERLEPATYHRVRVTHLETQIQKRRNQERNETENKRDEHRDVKSKEKIVKLEKELQQAKARVIGYNYPTTRAKYHKIHQSTFRLPPPDTQSRKQKVERTCKMGKTNAEANHTVYKQ